MSKLCDYGCGQLAKYERKNGKWCCSKDYRSCQGVIKKRPSRKKTIEQVITEFKNYWGDRFDYSLVDYQGTNSKVIIICPEHGEFTLYPYQHKKGVGCYWCGRKNAKKITAKKLRKTTSTFIKESTEIHGNSYTYGNSVYIQSRKPIIITCKIHGDFETTPQRHLDGRGCPICIRQSSSKEQCWLDSLNLPNDIDHRCVNLRLNNQSKFLVDGFDKKTNTVYEFHGDFWHGNPDVCNLKDIHPILKVTFGELYEKTKLKEKIITDSGFNLVVMWESEWDKIQLS